MNLNQNPDNYPILDKIPEWAKPFINQIRAIKKNKIDDPKPLIDKLLYECRKQKISQETIISILKLTNTR